ncbi:hypothetical protein F5Y06DRAFT_232222 [Hypoxylon sp. FL0890]|nr:hypothetical protein F5Y06DRAFT_232222 [Hypoxylon sp. FL0890]
MADCSVEGNTDMYGLGIRLGFYLNWYGGILAHFVAVKEIKAIQYAIFCFVAATFVAVVVQTARGALTVLDIYITLLLCFGYYFFLIPTFLWRLATCFQARLDPTRWPRVHPGPLFYAAHGILTIAVAIFQLWFWTSEILRSNHCPYYGFLFERAILSSVTLRIVNIALQSIIILIATLSMVMLLKSLLSDQPDKQSIEGFLREIIERQTGRHMWEDTPLSNRQKTNLQTIYSAILLVVASFVTAATELTITWNGVTGVNDLDTAGQLIPFLVGVGVIGRVLFIPFFSGSNVSEPSPNPTRSYLMGHRGHQGKPYY